MPGYVLDERGEAESAIMEALVNVDDGLRRLRLLALNGDPDALEALRLARAARLRLVRVNQQLSRRQAS